MYVLLIFRTREMLLTLIHCEMLTKCFSKDDSNICHLQVMYMSYAGYWLMELE